MTINYDPFSEAARKDPFPSYRELRDEAPAYWCENTSAWIISRYEDVHRVLTEWESFSSDAMSSAILGIPPGVDPMKDPHARQQLSALADAMPFSLQEFAGSTTLITADGPKHLRMRNIANRGFSPRQISAWEDRVRSIVSELTDKLRSESSFDLVSDFTVPLPMTVIIEMLGVEPEYRHEFKRWSDGIIAGATGSGRAAGTATGGFAQAMGDMSRYLADVAEQRRAEPRDDLISLLVQSQSEDRAEIETLSSIDLVLFGLVLLVAGNETTTNLLGNTCNALLDHPQQLAQAQSDPNLVPGLIEESLRFESPVQFVFRRATHDVEIAGTKIPKNSFVAALIGSANRDEREFEDPDVFDIRRKSQGHLAFGFGNHYCMGSHLARLEARISLEALVHELPQLERREPTVEYIDSYLVRGPSRLELVRKTAVG
ncbi:MAG: cytochrome P450 [Deltaproteobacteria bacterium]|nr:cytochrome P450 [Deltaproteobacteria bacterium]